MRCRRPFVFVALVVLSACEGCIGNYHGNLAPGVSVEKLLKVQSGMTYEQVVGILGQPLLMETFIGNGPDLRRTDDPRRGKVLLSYSQEIVYPAYTPNVYVSLESGLALYAIVKYRAPFGLAHESIWMTPGRNDSQRPWNFLVNDRDKTRALAELYDLFGERRGG